MPRGGPPKYTPELAAEIIDRLEQGETLIAICRTEGMPVESAVRQWVNADVDGFAAKYARAREHGYQRMADEIIEISDDGSNDWMLRNDPDNRGYRVNGEATSRSRLRVDTRKWLLGKVLPKIYGETSYARPPLWIEPDAVGELNPKGLLALSETATRRLLRGEIDMEQFRLVQEAIGLHAQKAGLAMLEDMRGQLDKLEEDQQEKGGRRLGLNGHTPAWGRFRKQSEQEIEDIDDADWEP
jgi:hypothetical protein